MATPKRQRPADELANLYPPPRIVAVKVRRAPDVDVFEDAEVTVAEMDIRQIAHATRALSGVTSAMLPTSSFIALASDHPDEVFAAIGIAIRWPAERVALLAGASFARVVGAVWESNQDFFVQLLALVASGGPAMATPSVGAGPTRSDTSSAGATSTQPATH